MKQEIKILRITENQQQQHLAMECLIEAHEKEGWKREGFLYITGGQVSAVEYFQVIVRDRK